MSLCSGRRGGRRRPQLGRPCPHCAAPSLRPGRASSDHEGAAGHGLQQAPSGCISTATCVPAHASTRLDAACRPAAAAHARPAGTRAPLGHALLGHALLGHALLGHALLGHALLGHAGRCCQRQRPGLPRPCPPRPCQGLLPAPAAGPPAPGRRQPRGPLTLTWCPSRRWGSRRLQGGRARRTRGRVQQAKSHAPRQQLRELPLVVPSPATLSACPHTTPDPAPPPFGHPHTHPAPPRPTQAHPTLPARPPPSPGTHRAC